MLPEAAGPAEVDGIRAAGATGFTLGVLAAASAGRAGTDVASAFTSSLGGGGLRTMGAGFGAATGAAGVTTTDGSGELLSMGEPAEGLTVPPEFVELDGSAEASVIVNGVGRDLWPMV